jgi:thioester reductase-like protein
MGYYLLTGATGFVGRYLMRDFLSRDIPLAVLVRPSRAASAAARIEAVMQHWEQQAGHALPRPVVIAGDLREPDLGLEPAAQSWLSRNADVMVHAAASMLFREDRKTGEPFRTNVNGTRHVLDLCRRADIRQFHYVSTAYVCGLRQGKVLESELDVGQTNGNVYEMSKLAAEKVVRSADFLEQVTVYRPASVVGDTTSGHTTSSHGFYLPLELAYIMADKIPIDSMNERFFELLGLTGQERKNLVPVDWVAAAIVRLVLSPQRHGLTYHLTSPEPVSVRTIQQVIQEAIERGCARRARQAPSREELATYERHFQEYMEVYRSHWRDDPTFDRTNAAAALDDLPCPEMTHEVLLRIAMYPVNRGFVLQPASEFPKQPFSAHDHLDRLAGRSSAEGTAQLESLGLQINGRGGGQWRLLVRNGSLVGAELGFGPQDRARFYLNSETFQSLVQAKVTVEQSVRYGRLLIEVPPGERGVDPDLFQIFEEVVTCA